MPNHFTTQPPLQQTPKRQQLLKRLQSKPSTKNTVSILLILVLLITVLPYFVPYNPYDLNAIFIEYSSSVPGSINEETRQIFWLGTDEQGRDMLSAIAYGLRISLFVGVISVSVAFIFGTIIGLTAAYFGGIIETLCMRFVDFMLGFPTILLALVILSIFGVGIEKVILALIMVQWANYARIMRGRALQEINKEYVQAAQNLGLSRFRIMFVHILPNCLTPVLVISTTQIASAISLEATLSYLGLGVPSTEPTLGMLIANGFNSLLSNEYWISIFPGVALLFLVLSINVLGDRLRNSLEIR